MPRFPADPGWVFLPEHHSHFPVIRIICACPRHLQDSRAVDATEAISLPWLEWGGHLGSRCSQSGRTGPPLLSSEDDNSALTHFRSSCPPPPALSGSSPPLLPGPGGMSLSLAAGRCPCWPPTWKANLVSTAGLFRSHLKTVTFSGLPSRSPES